MRITMESSGIKVEGHRGTWYVIDKNHLRMKRVFLLESEQYGEDAPNVIVDEDGKLIMDDVYNGFEDLWESEELL